jgi:hypothetical protein
MSEMSGDFPYGAIIGQWTSIPIRGTQYRAHVQHETLASKYVVVIYNPDFHSGSGPLYWRGESFSSYAEALEAVEMAMFPQPLEIAEPELHECCSCGKTTVFRWTPDPFKTEIWPEGGPYPEQLWCDECYQQRKDEI